MEDCPLYSDTICSGSISVLRPSLPAVSSMAAMPGEKDGGLIRVQQPGMTSGALTRKKRGIGCHSKKHLLSPKSNFT